MNLTSATDPAGRLTRYGCYADEYLKCLADPGGNVTTLKHDIQDRLTLLFSARLCMLYIRHAI